MALFTIKQGAHYHKWLPVSTLPWIGKRSMERYVTFDKNCRYDSAAYNAYDVNKLFGLSFGFGGVHHNSARFGWRWSQADQCIELLAYVYVNGKRNQDEQLRFPVVAQVKPGKRIWCSIMLDHDPETGVPHYVFEVDAPDQRWRQEVVIAPENLASYGLTCGLYFGGSLPAPHEMSVQIDRVK